MYMRCVSEPNCWMVKTMPSSMSICYLPTRSDKSGIFSNEPGSVRINAASSFMRRQKDAQDLMQS